MISTNLDPKPWWLSSSIAFVRWQGTPLKTYGPTAGEGDADKRPARTPLRGPDPALAVPGSVLEHNFNLQSSKGRTKTKWLKKDWLQEVPSLPSSPSLILRKELGGCGSARSLCSHPIMV